MTKKIAVVLSGCGYKDGSEITESVSVLIALSELGAEVRCFAPSDQLEASARIARDEISQLSELQEKDFDAVVFPGGSGAAKNLSTWATEGSKAKVNADVQRVILAFHKASKPIGAICIAPTLLARVLGHEHPELTIGDDAETAAEIEKTGAQHTRCSVDDYVSDRDHKLLTTPAYMFGHAKPNEVFSGIRRMLTELVEMA